VRPFAELTERGRVRRIRQVAEVALAWYDLDVVRLRFAAAATNSVFRVDAADGCSYALRVGTTRADTEVDTAAETAWLAALDRDTDLPLVKLCLNRDGLAVTHAQADGVPEVRSCVLFKWLPGALLDDRASPTTYAELGRIAAALHDHGRSWDPPPGLRPLVWNRIFYYPDEPVVMFEPAHRSVLYSSRLALFETVMERAETELATLHRTGRPGYIHGDLNPWNAMVNRSGVTVFDFEDVMLGFPVQDVAIALFYGRDRGDYQALCAGFRTGYASRRPWPVEYDGQLELLMAARSIMFVNYVMRTSPSADDAYSPTRYTERVTKRLQLYLDQFPKWPPPQRTN
jgi:Ser/Thr protein kinase RdoA (MazF antagonist)